MLSSFVTVADEVSRLQRGEHAEGRIFQGFCEQGHYGGRSMPTDTRQGIYAVTPSGRLLASINTRRAESMAKMLRTALARWAELPAEERRLDDDAAKQLGAARRFEDRFPTDGVGLVEYVRDVGRSVGEDWRTRAWNIDHAWFTAAEAASFVPEPTVGATTPWPQRLADRLVRLHLVDFVRGQTPPIPRGAVVEAAVTSEVVAVDGEECVVQFRGTTRTEIDGSWPKDDAAQKRTHGVATTVTGRARWQAKSRRFTTFELLAIGERWGATQYNERANEQASSAIGFAFVLASPEQPRVAPAFWWDYALQ